MNFIKRIFNGNDKVSEEKPRTFKNVLVTGGAGFIGSHLVKYLNEMTNWEITVLDSMTYAADLENLNGAKFKFLKVDITDMKALDKMISKTNYDAFIHLAAESHVDRSISDPLSFLKTNVNGTANLLEIATRLHSTNPNFIFYHVLISGTTSDFFSWSYALPILKLESTNEITYDYCHRN